MRVCPTLLSLSLGWSLVCPSGIIVCTTGWSRNSGVYGDDGAIRDIYESEWGVGTYAVDFGDIFGCEA